METKQRKILVMLTRFPDLGSRIVSWFTNSYYTHASIGLNEDKNTFYSFVNPRGFLVEKIDRYLKPGRKPYPCAVYELPVPEHIYQYVKDILHRFGARKQRLRYAKFGVVLALLRIPYCQENHYFCSQFVADVLCSSGAFCMKKRSFQCMPGDFCHLEGFSFSFQGNHLTMHQKYVLLAPER